jgi:arsenical pump membrane protein
MWLAVVSILIFVITLFLVIKRPFGLNIGLGAGLGAVISLLVGTVTVYQAAESLFYIWDGVVAFLGIIILSICLDAMGFFRWAANKMVIFAGGSGVKLYFYLALLAVGVSVLFSNDSAILILTPIVIESVKQLEFDRNSRLPYLFAAGLISDTAAMPLITSNPVNIVSADFFGYTFIDHLILMGPVALATILVSMFVVYGFFRKSIPRTYSPCMQSEWLNSCNKLTPIRFRLIIFTLIAIDVAYVVTSLLRIPVSFVILSGALFLVLMYWVTSREEVIADPKRKSVGEMLRNVNWGILLFMIAIFIVVQGLGNTGIIDYLAGVFTFSTSLPPILSLLVPALIVTLGASFINNWPMTLLGMLSISGAITASSLSSSQGTGLIFSNIIGNNLGPHFFPLGSLAILIWLDIIRRKGFTIKLKEYIKIGALLSIVEVLVATMVLWFEITILNIALPI